MNKYFSPFPFRWIVSLLLFMGIGLTILTIWLSSPALPTYANLEDDKIFRGSDQINIAGGGLIASYTVPVTSTWVSKTQPLFFQHLEALTGLPSFTNSVNFGTGNDATLGDMDGDGDLDIVTGSVVYINDGGGEFLDSVNYGTGGRAVGDMDGDGDLDIVTESVVYLNDGRGEFPDSVNFGTAESVIIGDMDGDGDLDIVTGSVVYLNDGGGEFLDSVNYGTGGRAVGDMDGDGDLDIVTESVVYINDGGGEFSDSVNYGTAEADSVVIGDMDGDGHLDIVAGNSGYLQPDPQNVVYLNDGEGNFNTSMHFGTGDDATRCIAVGDMNGDGDLDVVTGNSNAYNGEQNVVYLNDGRGNLTTSVNFGTGNDNTGSVTVGDINGDGHLDIVTVNSLEQNVIYLNNGGGNITTSVNLGAGVDSASTVALGDMDGDGNLDIIAGNNGQNVLYPNDGLGNFPITTTFGTGNDWTMSIAVGDMDGDDDLDIVTGNIFDQNAIYLNDGRGNFGSSVNFGTGDDYTVGVAVGDMDGDGDLDIFIGNYGRQQNVVYLNDGGGNFGSSVNFGTGDDYTYSVAAGDLDGDGDLDIVAGNSGQNVVYLNDGAGHFTTNPLSAASYPTCSIVVGDMDGDNDLDIVTGNDPGQKAIFLNDGGGSFTNSVNFGAMDDNTKSIAVGDLDGDGDLDIVVGNDQDPPKNQYFLNDGEGNFPTQVEFGIQFALTYSVSVGDLDGDGDLDIVVGNSSMTDRQSRVYLNNLHKPNGLTNNPQRISVIRPGTVPEANFFHTPKILDDNRIPATFILYDQEGDPVGDVALSYSINGVGRWLPGVTTKGAITSLQTSSLVGIDGYWPFDEGSGVTTVDASGHGMTGTLMGNTVWGANTFDSVHTNPYALVFDGESDYVDISHVDSQNPGEELTLAAWVKLEDANSDQKIIGKALLSPVTAGYVLGVGYGSLYPEIWDSTGTRHAFQNGSVASGIWTHLAITWKSGDYLRGYINGLLVEQIPASNYPVGSVDTVVRIGAAPWSTTSWEVAGHIDDARIYDRQLSAAEILALASGQCLRGCAHTFQWDTFASGFSGQSDNVVLRLETVQQSSAGAPGTFKYFNSTPGPIQWPYDSATTFPFRVRGTQVRVFDEADNPVQGAVVYHLLANQTEGAQPYTNNAGQLFQTDHLGYLQGYGELYPGDQIAALLPIANTDNYTVYLNSAPPITATGSLDMYEVTGFGVQELAVSESNPLILFNLDISLEWDARYSQGDLYLDQLEFDLGRASELLFDWTNGQAALGKVRVFQNREHWNDAHIRIYATNRLRPNANQGGVVSDVYTETIGTDVVTYQPGQVRMGAVWNRFGDYTGNLGEDWPRTLAHELGHYLFFLDDNYLGLSEDGTLFQVETCPGAMTDPYSDDDTLGFDEFHPETDWLPECKDTLSQQATGRSDWETIQTFYPWLDAAPENPGPHVLPLAVTQIEIIAPDDQETAIDVPIFYLKKLEDSSTYLPTEQARAFLLQGDRLVDLGRPVNDLVNARGARVGETLCAFDLPAHRGGCETLSLTGEQLHLAPLPGWEPDVVVTPVTSRTFQIEVGHVPGDGKLKAHLYPNSADAPGEIELTQTPDGTYMGEIQTTDPVLFGYVHIWVTSSSPPQEIITDFSIGGNPGPRRAGPGSLGPRRAGPGSLAPVVSGDGQAIIYGDAAFEEGQFYVMQTATYLELPAGVHAVGQGYYLKASSAAPDLSETSISVSYLETEVPRTILEEWLIIYFYDGTKWIALETTVDVMMNYASARTQGPGLYVLAYGEGSYETFLPAIIR